MPERVVTPAGRGLLLLDSHPAGCFRTVTDLRERLGAARPPQRRPTALVIGSSAGYGLATTVAGLARHGIEGVGTAPPTCAR